MFKLNILLTVADPRNTHKCVKVFYKHSIPPASFDHQCGSPQGVLYKGWMHDDIAKICEPQRRCKIISFKNTNVSLKFSILYPCSDRVLVGKPEGKRPLGRPRRRWEDNIKMDFQKVGRGCVDWMELAQDRDRWRALVSTVVNFGVP